MFTNKDLKKLILPLIIEQILVMLVGLTDTMMISYAGEAAISGVALVNMVNELIVVILGAIATGGAVIVSQYIGSKQRENANMCASQLLTITASISILIMIFCLLTHQLILNLLFGAVELEVMQAASIYFLIVSLSFPFLGIYNSSTALFRSMGRTKTTMVVSAIMNVINIIGNSIGVFVLHAGVAGVAVPTLISRAFAACVMLYLLFDAEHEVSVNLHHIFTINRSAMKRILSIAIPNGIENGLFQLGRVLVTSIVALFGTAQIAANGVANSIDSIAIIFVQAANLAVVTLVGQCVGAEEYDQAAVYIKKMMKIAYVVTGIMNLVVFVSLPFILSFYTLSDEARTFSYVLIIMHNLLAFFLHPTSFILPNGLRAAGDVKFTMVIGIASMLLFRLGSAVLFGIVLNLGIYGVWIAMGVDWLFRSILFTIRFKSNTWRQFRAI